MGALKVNEQTWRWKGEAYIYLNYDFRIGNWSFIWKDVEEGENKRATVYNNRHLWITGGFLGNEGAIVINPLQLAISISVAKSCTVHCGGNSDEVEIKFTRGSIRMAEIIPKGLYSEEVSQVNNDYLDE